MSSNSKEDLSKNFNNTSIDTTLESSMKEFLEKMLNYLEKFIISDDEIEEVEKKLFDYSNLNELMDIIKNIFNDLTIKINKSLKSKESFKHDDKLENSLEDYTKLEKILQKHEGEIRNHISIEQQLRLCAESLQSKVEETEKIKYVMSESTNQLINSLKKEKTELISKSKKLFEENEKIKKILLINEQNEKELMQKLENLPFLQQKIKALEAILKRKKSSKVSSFEKIEENSSVNYGLKIYENKKKEKEDSNIGSPLEKSAESRINSKDRRGKHSFHQSGGNSVVNNFQDFLKLRIALGKDLSERKDNNKKTNDELKKAINQLPLFKLPKHPIVVDSKEKINKEIERKTKEINKKKISLNSTKEKLRNNEFKNKEGANPAVSTSNFNISVTNLTNSLIVTQHNNSNKKIENIPNNAFDIPKNIIKSTTANHKKSKSQGAVKNHNSVSSNSITAQALIKKYPLPIGSYKTSQEFFDPRQKRGK